MPEASRTTSYNRRRLPEDHEPTERWVNGDSQESGQRTLGTVQGKGYDDAGTSPPVWAKSLLTTFQLPSMRTSWK